MFKRSLDTIYGYISQGNWKRRSHPHPLNCKKEGSWSRVFLTKPKASFSGSASQQPRFLEGIRNRDNDIQLKFRLKQLPKELDDIYNTLLTRIGPQYRLQAIRYFQLLHLEMFQREPKLSVLVLSFN
jgi:hypothetical protein